MFRRFVQPAPAARSCLNVSAALGLPQEWSCAVYLETLDLHVVPAWPLCIDVPGLCLRASDLHEDQGAEYQQRVFNTKVLRQERSIQRTANVTSIRVLVQDLALTDW